MYNSYSKEATGCWPALKHPRRNRVSQKDADSDAAPKQALSSNLLAASSWKLPSVFAVIKPNKPSLQNTDFFIFFFILVQENGER